MSEEALQIAEKRKDAKGKGEKEIRVPKNNKDKLEKLLQGSMQINRRI